jgi:cell division septal protein FtsQ
MNMQHAERIQLKSTNSPQKIKRFFSMKLDNKILIRLFVSLLVLVFLGFLTNHSYRKLCQSDFFQITTINIDGNRMTNKEQIVALSSIDIHSNLLAMDVTQVQSNLENHPWIAQATIDRDWPNRLVITIKEKTPAALLNQNDGLWYLDRKGRVIAQAEPLQELDFPVITGLEKLSPNNGLQQDSFLPLQDVFALLKLAGRGNSILPSQNISEIHINEKGEMILYLLDRPFPIHFGTNGKISTRYYRLVKILKNLYKSREFSEIAYIRMDYMKDTVLVGKTKPMQLHRG